MTGDRNSGRPRKGCTERRGRKEGAKEVGEEEAGKATARHMEATAGAFTVKGSIIRFDMDQNPFNGIIKSMLTFETHGVALTRDFFPPVRLARRHRPSSPPPSLPSSLLLSSAPLSFPPDCTFSGYTASEYGGEKTE